MRSETNMLTVPQSGSPPIAVFLNSLAGELNALLADIFALYLKTKNFHWHMSGPHFRDFHLMLDDHANQLLAMTDEIAERVRKIRCKTLRSIGEIAKLQTIVDNDEDNVTAQEMLKELYADEMLITSKMHAVHALCDEAGDIASSSLLENWIDQSQRRAWFLVECSRDEGIDVQKRS